MPEWGASGFHANERANERETKRGTNHARRKALLVSPLLVCTSAGPKHSIASLLLSKHLFCLARAPSLIKPRPAPTCGTSEAAAAEAAPPGFVCALALRTSSARGRRRWMTSSPGSICVRWLSRYAGRGSANRGRTGGCVVFGGDATI